MTIQTVPEEQARHDNEAIQAARKAAIEASTAKIIAAGETPQTSSSDSDLFLVVDNETQAPVFLSSSTLRSVESTSAGNRTIAIGDSTIIGSDIQSVLYQGGSWFSLLCQVSGQRMRFLRNAGVGGETSAQFFARLDADVIAHRPSWCVIGGPVNDAQTGLAQATSRAHYINGVSRLRSAGIRPILCTCVPSDNATYRNWMTEVH